MPHFGRNERQHPCYRGSEELILLGDRVQTHKGEIGMVYEVTSDNDRAYIKLIINGKPSLWPYKAGQLFYLQSE